MEHVKLQTELLLGITAEHHNITIYEVGVQWLNMHFEKAPYNLQRWERSRTFWQWWTHMWYVRCHEALQRFEYETRQKPLNSTERNIFLLFLKNHHGTGAVKAYPCQSVLKKIRNEQLVNSI